MWSCDRRRIPELSQHPHDPAASRAGREGGVAAAASLHGGLLVRADDGSAMKIHDRCCQGLSASGQFRGRRRRDGPARVLPLPPGRPHRQATRGQRACRDCIAKSRIEPATRDAQGRPLCPNCRIREPANRETCTVCGESRMVDSRTSEGLVCPNCRPLPVLKLTGRPRCGGYDGRQAHCTVCGRPRGIHSGTADAPVCGPCCTSRVRALAAPSGSGSPNSSPMTSAP